ncbi:MAG: hypothetical protein ACLGH3_02575 [Actinomycetota bacterium]
MEARVYRRNRHIGLSLAGLVTFSILAGLTGAQAAGEPTITAARTADDGDGHIDAIRITFSDAMSATSPTSSWFAASQEDPGFFVEGYPILSASWEPAGQATATTLRLNLTPKSAFDTGATPKVHYKPVAGGPRSAATGLSLSGTSQNGMTPLDAAGPVLAKVTALDMPSVNLFNISGDRLGLHFSEPVRLAGVAGTRTANLENAIRFTGINEGFNGCPLDGDATSNQNFPQAGTGTSPIEPTSPADASAVITVTMRPNNIASIQRFISVPKGCFVGVDTSNAALITDGAGNIASHQNLPTTAATRRRIQSADIALSTAKTLDGLVGTPDGVADGMDITFDQPLNDSTLGQLASQLSVTAGGTPVTGLIIETGSAANDANIRIKGALPAGEIVVSTTRAACTQDSTGTQTTGVTGPVAFGAPYAACLGTSSLTALDGVGPAIVSARTADLDSDGQRDAVQVVFTEAVASGTANGWTLDGVSATGFTLGSDPKNATIDFPEAGASAPATPTLAYTTQGSNGTVDGSGNQVPTMSVVTTNGLRPSITGATIQDTNSDGVTDQITVRSNRPVTVTAGTGFTYEGIKPTAASASGQDIILTFAGLTSGAPADLVFDGTGVTDSEGATFDATTLAAAAIGDSVAPVVRNASTLDTNANGRYEAIEANFAEPITASGPEGWTLEGQNASGATTSNGGRTLRLTFPEAAADATPTPQLTYAAPLIGGTKDAADNATPNRAYTAASGLGPSLDGATISDADGNGLTDTVTAHASRPVVLAGTPGFSYGGSPITSATASGKDIVLRVAEEHGGTPKALAFDGTGVSDAEGVQMRARTLDASTVVDAVAPVGTIQVLPQAPIPAGDATVQVRFTEAMSDTALTVKMDDEPVAPMTGAGYSLRGWKSSDPTTWEGKITVTEEDCTVSTGCPVTFTAADGVDTNGVVQAVVATFQTIIDTAPPAPAIISRTASVSTSGTAPSGFVNSTTENLSVTVDVPTGEADGGTVEVLIDGGAMNQPLFAEIEDGMTQVTLTTQYATPEELHAALGGEGPHALSTQLCDASYNCVNGDDFEIVVDTIGVEILVDEPSEDALVSGGDIQTIGWQTQDTGEPVAVELSYSFDGIGWMSIVDGLPSFGTFDWKLPKADAQVQVRGVSKDRAGNTVESLAPATLTIDSSAPKITWNAPGKFIESGGVYQLEWTAEDASIDRVENPIRLEESVDGGRNWRPINGGQYDMSNDGAESWNIPDGVGIGTRIRITALDATGRKTVVRTYNLIRGVRGAVVDSNGRVAGYGSLEGKLSKRFGSDFARDVALLSGGNSGYVLGKDGSLHAFAFNGASTPEAVTGPKLKGIARQLIMLTDSSGYVVDAYGRLFRFGGAPMPSAATRWIGKDWTRDAVLLSGGQGGYVLDRFGRAHPFKIGKAQMPRKIQRFPVTKQAAALILNGNERSGWILAGRGELIRFGGAPKRANPDQGRGIAVAGIRVTGGSGYWMDAAGVFHSWGNMPGRPHSTRFPAGTVRSAS